MTDDLNVEGMAIAPGVVETIIAIATTEVEGVASIGSTATSNIRKALGAKPSVQGIDVVVDENNQLQVSVRLEVNSGYPLPEIAAKVRSAIAAAAESQIGVSVSSVDIYIDAIHFTD